MSVKLRYGDTVTMVREASLELDDKTLRKLLDGTMVIDINYPNYSKNADCKCYYIGVLFEIFKHNYSPPAFGNKDVFGMMCNAYPIFLNQRQLENNLSQYWNLKKIKNVFDPT